MERLPEIMGQAATWTPIVLSLAALVVSFRANRHAKRSADSSERSARASELSAEAAQATAKIDRQRLHREQSPIFDVKNELIAERGQEIGGMWVKLIGPSDLDKVKVRFETPAPGEAHFVRQISVANRWSLTSGQQMNDFLSLRVGERFGVLFHLDDPNDPQTRGIPVRLRLECHRQGWEPWTVIVEGETPSWPTVLVD